jgi:MFS transporter, OCT family, solute carrier family 22 (organic cation transporter), member 4/5
VSSVFHLQGSNYDVRHPYIILFVLFLVGGIAALFLPETLHQNLPESMTEAQRFGKDQKFWSWPRPHQPKETAAELEKLNNPEHKL